MHGPMNIKKFLWHYRPDRA